MNHYSPLSSSLQLFCVWSARAPARPSPPNPLDLMPPARATSLLLLLLLLASAGGGGGGGGEGAGSCGIGSSPPHLRSPQSVSGGPPNLLSFSQLSGGDDELGGGPVDFLVSPSGGGRGFAGFSGYLLPPVGAVGGWGVVPFAKRRGSRGTSSTSAIGVGVLSAPVDPFLATSELPKLNYRGFFEN